MPRLATIDVVQRLVADAEHDLAEGAVLFALVQEQKLNGPASYGLGGGYPTSPRGEALSDDGADIPGRAIPEPYSDDHPDPCGEAAIAQDRPAAEADDKRAQLAYLDALVRLRKARQALAARIPAMAAARNAKRPPTDGRTADEIDAKRRGAVEAESSCVVCDLGVTVAGRLTGGMCAQDRMRWVWAGRPERSLWVLQQRQATADVATEGPDAEIIPLRRPEADTRAA